jgi:methionyl-tRNA formyltransferase
MKKYSEKKIIFLGTADYAVACLDSLIENGFNVVAVVTGTDKPAGRGQKMSFSPVKEAALRHHLPILQPKNLKSPDFHAELNAFSADLFVVVAFRMLPEAVWNMPPMGTINVHASLLPNYRGAAPINWAIINGENETGVSTFKLKQEVDAGDILMLKKENILENDTFETLYNKLKIAGAEILPLTLSAVFDGTIQPISQAVAEICHYAPKIFPETGNLNFKKPVREVYNLIRGLNPFPAARFFLGEKMYKIFAVEMGYQNEQKQAAGKIFTDNKSFLHIFCDDGYIDVKEIQPEGKKRMSVKDFFNGNKLPL